MHFWLLAPGFFLQADDLKLELKRFDRLTVALTIRTEISASDGRDSKHETQIEVVYDCDKAESGTIALDGQAQTVKSSGTVRGREFAYEWKKGGTAKATGQKHAALAALERPFKLKVSDRGDVTDPGLGEWLETFPVFNPSVLVGLPCPLGTGATWKLEPRRCDWYSGFAVEFNASNKGAGADGTSLYARLKFAPPETEVPIEGMVNVKGSGDASGAFDAKKKRPVKGEFNATVTCGQGGLRREVNQHVEWTVK